MIAASIATQFLGQMFSNFEAAARVKEENRLIRERKDDINEEFLTDYGKNYVESAGAVAAQTRMKDQMDDIMGGMKANAVKTGATAEAQVAQMGELNKGYGDFMGNLAAIGERRKEVLRQQRSRDMNSIFGLELGQAKEQTASAANTASNWGNVGQAGLAAFSMNGGQQGQQNVPQQQAGSYGQYGNVVANNPNQYWNWNF